MTRTQLQSEVTVGGTQRKRTRLCQATPPAVGGTPGAEDHHVGVVHREWHEALDLLLTVPKQVDGGRRQQGGLARTPSGTWPPAVLWQLLSFEYLPLSCLCCPRTQKDGQGSGELWVQTTHLRRPEHPG